MIDRILSVPVSRVGQTLGELAATEDMQAVHRAIVVYLGFAD